MLDAATHAEDADPLHFATISLSGTVPAPTSSFLRVRRNWGLYRRKTPKARVFYAGFEEPVNGELARLRCVTRTRLEGCGMVKSIGSGAVCVSET